MNGSGVLKTAVILGLGCWILAGTQSARAEETNCVTVGTVTEKDERTLFVKATGEEKAEKYLPRHAKEGEETKSPAGMKNKYPADIMKAIAEIKVGDQVEVTWSKDANSNRRIEKVRVLTKVGATSGK
jgi:hypothetical protein